MLKRTLATSLLIATGVAGTLCARAADMPALFPQAAGQDVPPPQMEFGTGWYLRGDVTGSYDREPSILGTLAASSVRRDWNYGVGGGVGYQFTDYFRADVTGDYLSSERRGTENPIFSAQAHLDRWDSLVNGYVDLGNWSGLTPYIGAGVGVAGVSTSGSVTFADGTGFKVGGHDDYHLAWAAMAGVAYHISPHLLLDVGYRYLDLGTYRAPQGSAIQRAVYSANKTDLDSHEIRVGVRYQID